MKVLKIFAISFALIFIFAVFGALSFSSISRSKATVYNFDKGATVFVPVYEVSMEPLVISAVSADRSHCSNDWVEPVDSKCCV